MSSAASNRYQSRLFNFVYKRSRRLSERVNRVWQNVANWIMPVVTYPAQVLHEAVHNSLPQLPKVDKSSSPLNVDTPVKNVLQLVEMQADEKLGHISQPTIPTNFLARLGAKFFAKTKTTFISSSEQSEPKLLVQGIASHISNRTLVLVTPQNEILDILNSQQQQRLQARIIDEVAQYWRYQRLLAASAETTDRLQLPAQQPLPVRLFSNIATWLQVKGTPKESSDRSLQNSFDERQELIFATSQAIAFLDRSIAQFESNHLAPVAGNAIKTNKLPIQALIWAAIDYFFGDRQGKKLAAELLENHNLNLPTANTSNFLTASEDKIADPWLTLDDLFGESKLLKQPAIVSNHPKVSAAQLPENSNLTRSSQLLNKYSLRSLFKRIQQNKSSTQLAKTSAPTQLAKVKQQKSKAPNVAKQLPAKREASAVLNSTNNVVSPSSINHAPDWIETEVISTGYIKHPLEQLLAWLDSAMLWLENLLVKIWQQLQKLLIGK